MERILDVAQFICSEYKRISGDKIDEMKLHKLLYFAQRESFAITGQPLFSEEMKGWKYGPVSVDVRFHYNEGEIEADTKEIDDESAYILRYVILEYGSIASWKLSDITHQEQSWQNAREGLGPAENGDKPLKLEDIIEDAKKVRPYDHVWDMYYDEFDDLKEEVIES